jgi:hypothetical protein
MKALLDNDLDAIRALAGRFLASYLVLGRALSEPSQSTEGIVSARARITLRVVEAESGRIVTNQELAEMRGFDLAVDRAGQKALRTAGAAAGDYVVEQLDRHFKRKERTVQIHVRGLAALEDFERFKGLLQSLRWVSDLSEQTYSPAESVIAIRYPEKSLYLAGRIGREPGYRVVEFDRTRVLVEVRQ